MLFLWDTHKAKNNLHKHGVSFEIAQTIFDDPLHVSVLDSKTRHEERWVTLGKCITGKILVVVHTYHVDTNGSETIRVISSRPATKKERKHYEEGI